MTEQELKPCPFCGGKAGKVRNYQMHAACLSCPPTSEFIHPAIQCLRCGGVMMGTSEMWNRRQKEESK